MLLLHLYLSHIDFTAKSSFYRSHFDINGLKIDGNSVPSGQSLKAVTSVRYIYCTGKMHTNYFVHLYMKICQGNISSWFYSNSEANGLELL